MDLTCNHFTKDKHSSLLWQSVSDEERENDKIDGRLAESSGNGKRSPQGPRANPLVAKLADRIDKQLIQGPLAPSSHVLEPGTRPERSPGLWRRQPSGRLPEVGLKNETKEVNFFSWEFFKKIQNF